MKHLEAMHDEVDSLSIDLALNVKEALLSLKVPEAPHYQTRDPQGNMPSPLAQVQALKMQVSNEKVIVSIQQMLNLIKQIRSLALLHDVQAIRYESKDRSDEVRNHNRHEMISFAERITEVDTLIEEATREIQGL